MRQLITAGQVLTGPAGSLICDGAVLVDGARIVAVGPAADVARQAGPEVRRRDYPAHTLLPGLINCHVHLALDAGPAPLDNLLAVNDDELLAGMAQRARQALAAGVTTLRDLGDRRGLAMRLRDQITAGEVAGPRIVASGPPLTIPRDTAGSSAAWWTARTTSAARSSTTRPWAPT
ncbi:MAG TPA: amidohydrolase family protein [Streptosporangiaceae bacterium]